MRARGGDEPPRSCPRQRRDLEGRRLQAASVPLTQLTRCSPSPRSRGEGRNEGKRAARQRAAFLSAPLFALLYQVEIRHPRLLKKETAPLDRASNAATPQCHYSNSIVAVCAALVRD
jgi:hypothetical protein